MDTFESILIFCNDDEHPDVAVTTSLQVENYDHAPMMITTKKELYSACRLILTDPGDWNLQCLYKTMDLWLEFIIVLRGDVVFSDEAITLIFAHASEPTDYFYFANGSLVAFTARAKDLRLAKDSVLGGKHPDLDNWGGLIGAIKSRSGKVSEVNIKVGGIND